MRRAVATLAHPGHAGMLRALRVLDDAAPRHGWELRFVLSEPHPIVEDWLARERTAYLADIGRWRRWSVRLRAGRTVARLVDLAAGADVLYCVTLSTFPFCRRAGERAGVPQVVHVYSSYGDPSQYRKHLLAKARHVVAPSADSLRLAAAAVGGFAPGTRAHVVYNGQDVAAIRARADAELPVAVGTGPLIGMVGNLDWRKNPLLLVEAAALVRREVPGVRVVLVGAFADPRYEARVRDRIRALGLHEAVSVTGFLSNPFPLMRRLDVLVHPAVRDPFPLALLEGMALARPIVATAVGGIPEMLVDRESGRLVPEGDAAALAAAIVETLRDPAAGARLGAGAYARLTTHFTLEGFAARMFGVFDQAVADGVP